MHCRSSTANKRPLETPGDATVDKRPKLDNIALKTNQAEDPQNGDAVMEKRPKLDNVASTTDLAEDPQNGDGIMEKRPKLDDIASTTRTNLAEDSQNGDGCVSIKSEPPDNKDDEMVEGEVSDDVPLDIKRHDLNVEEHLEGTSKENGLDNKEHGLVDMPTVQDNKINKNLKVVHLKNVCIVVNGQSKTLLYEFTKFLPYSNDFYFIRKLRDESNRVLDECLLKFNDAAVAAMVATSLNSITYKDRVIQAELKPNDYVPERRVYYNSDPSGVHTKMGSNSKDGNGTLESPKIAKFDEVWEVANAKRKPAWTTRHTEDTFGVNPSILSELGANKLTQCIIVKNLHEDVTEAKLHEVFSMAGNIRYMKYKQYEYKSKKKDEHKARIEYEHPVEALQAVSLFNGQNLYGLELKVALFTQPSPRDLPVGLGGIGKGFGYNGKPLQAVTTYLHSRRMYEIFHDMGKVQKTSVDQHPFLGYYNYKSVPVMSSDKFSEKNATPSNKNNATPPNKNNATPSNKKNATPSKPDTDTAIEALGAVLVALDLIPPQTNHKDLKSIVNALQQHPKVKQHAASKKKQKAKQPQVKPGNRGAQYQEFIRSLNSNSNFLQKNAKNTGQNTSNTGPQGASNMPINSFHPNVQNAVGTVQNMNRNQTNADAHANSNTNSTGHHQNRNHDLPNMHQNMANMSQNIPEAPLPPRWGDPRAQSIPQNISQHTISNRNYLPNSNSVVHNRHPNLRDNHNSHSQPIRPHYDPRNESRYEDIDYRDNFKSDLLQLQNLPASVNSMALIEKMEDVGEIIFAEVTGRGQALVRFKRVEDADMCIRMFHRSKVDGHIIDVSPV